MRETLWFPGRDLSFQRKKVIMMMMKERYISSHGCSLLLVSQCLVELGLSNLYGFIFFYDWGQNFGSLVGILLLMDSIL